MYEFRCGACGERFEALVDAAFWASLQREEGYPPEISLAFLPPEPAVRPLRLAAALPLGPRTLARLAPAVERPGIHLGVWREGAYSPDISPEVHAVMNATVAAGGDPGPDPWVQRGEEES